MVGAISRATKLLELLAAKSISIYKIASVYYKSLVKEEVSLASIKSTDKVLCIGGGPCPFSGILLHEYTGAYVTIIDNDNLSVRTARELVEKLGYADYIDVIHSDGNDIFPTDYDVIHMALQVSPMDQVFCNMKKRCSFGSKILVRLPKKGLTKFYDINDHSIFINCYKKSVHNWRNVDSTALFVKS
ncbi:MAG: class I SAM-dependent methyltransferase [Epulopiscium sp.]|jgi:hypothetical protein|nr:class I SAM-dependent methyltransferase [Candidatus Epulonipiscium sp.]